MIHRFGDCELNTEQHELRVKGISQALEPQVFRLLVILIENHNRVVTRDELIDTVWQGRTVSNSALASRIKSARQAIGDSGERQAFIQTVHGSGYRFVGAVRTESETPREPGTPLQAPSAPEARLSPRFATLFNRVRSFPVFRRQRRQWLAVFLLLVVAGIGAMGWRMISPISPPRSIAQKSIAVLPFVDMSEEGNQEYFADGVAEEILHALAKVKGLRVVGRTSSFAFKGKNMDVKTIGEQLNVATVLEGSIRRFQDRVRIAIQLVDTSSGYHLWSEMYDRHMQDIFAIQNDIARAVAHRLNLGLGDEDADRPLVAQETDNIEVYRLYLQGRYLWKRRYGDNLPRAIKLFREAIARDPDFARAYSALAAAYVVLPVYTKANHGESFKIAERTAHTALKLAPELSEPHAILGRVYSRRSEWRRAERQFRRTIALKPVDPVTYLWYGVHSMSVGRLSQALTQYEKALSIDPAWGLAVCLHSEALYALGQREAAARAAELAVALDFFSCHSRLGDMAYEMGHLDKAIHHFIEHKRLLGASEGHLKKLRRIYETNLGLAGSRSAFLQKTEQLLQSSQISPQTAFYRFYYAMQIDRATEVFDAKAEPKFLLWLRKTWGPFGRPFRTHPRFASIAANLDLISYWREFGWPDHCGPDPRHGVQCH